MKESRTQNGLERVEKIRAEWKAKPRLWHEFVLVGVFYAVYTLARNVHGKQLSVTAADNNAQQVVSAERWLHIFNEEAIQKWLLQHEWAIKFFNIWYGTAHFILTIGILLWLYHVKTERYRKWRNVLFATTIFALIGYIVYPLTPPRLLPPSYGFVDTLDTIGGLWNFESGAVAKSSNQYAAMPSLHTAWALWCSLSLFGILKHWWARVLIVIYPCITITAIVVTANHYWMDVFGGMLVLALGYGLAELIHRRRQSAFYLRIEEATRHAKRDESDHPPLT